MYSFTHCKLIKKQEGFEILLFLDSFQEESSEEFGFARDDDKESIENDAVRYIKEKLPNLKEGVVKVMGGAVLVTAIVLGGEENKVEASETDDPSEKNIDTEDTSLNNDIYFETKGDAIEHVNEIITDSLDLVEYTLPVHETKPVIPKVDAIPEFDQSSTVVEQTEPKSNVDQEELNWLAKMIYCEAKGESLEGQIAVGAVILNRVNNNQFPDNVEDVILEQNSGHYQFSPAASGMIYEAKPDATSMEAANRALSGEDPTNGSLYFYNPDKTDDQWIRSRPVSVEIGNHVFSL